MEQDAEYEVFGNLISATRKVLFSYDVDAATFISLNAAYGRIWQRTRESALADPATVWEAVHPDDRDFLAKEYDELVAGIMKEDLEFRLVLPDKSVRWLLLNPHLITGARGGKVIEGFVDDITAQKENIGSLQKYVAKKDSVLEILSHDLAGPLHNIHSPAAMLAETTAAYGNEEVNKIVSLIGDSSARNVRLIREFVQQEFLESSQTVMKKGRVDLVAMVSEIIGQYREGEGHIQKQIRFSCQTEKLYAQVDQYKFSQVINNLLSNAIKFTEDEGVIAIVLEEKEECVLITVQDDGVGIPVQYQDELFEKFTRARRPGLRGEPSTGLGMSIIKTIVEWHGGTIRFESEEGKGSTFYIELPKE
ncbi:ATP-binding protein [Rufibacter sediminis]|uniref:histidine kinase n=1 Tax=Rufibacter sediminis TaxID=2762756 RepID=A0ABR6VP80_9BACT|nr:HAMP domain-containing sensor histidine kinase [Rufibacter sediminis]MBC3539000.1 HAMP domain-containing histidine kinase [Rufibacter sediminis]